ncbi:MAG TPA: hypothetical protein VHZ03_30065 [Trebonia sp.]|jgi:hypothetical protein|nr:hypothetical protein [Trebonia sp.]
MGTVPGGKAGGRVLGVAVYVVLFVLGALQGLVGSFQYSQSPAPVVAIGLDAVILATCVLAGWGTRSFGGSLAAAGGWLVASFIMAIGTHGGSVIITNTAAGEWYLYGGTLSVLLGSLATFVLLTRLRAERH